MSDFLRFCSTQFYDQPSMPSNIVNSMNDVLYVYLHISVAIYMYVSKDASCCASVLFSIHDYAYMYRFHQIQALPLAQNG